MLEVFLCFGKSLPLFSKHSDLIGSAMAQLAGVHSSVTLAFLRGDGDGVLTVFDINVNTQGFEEQRVPADISSLQPFYDFLDVCVDPEEYERLLNTCRACVRAKKRYNYRDVVLYNVPFREPMEKSLFHTETLFDAQAAILILRECLSPEHPARTILHALHSRTTMPAQLYDMLSPILIPTHVSRVCAASRERDDGVSVMQPEPCSPH